MEGLAMWRQRRMVISGVTALAVLPLMYSRLAIAQSDAAIKAAPQSGSTTPRLATPDNRSKDFPPELVNWKPWPGNPVFTAEGAGHWDVKIRERGWILRDGNAWQLWFTGYDGTRE